MRLRTFSAATLPEAMAKVRQTLGEDAVILSSTEDEDNGKVHVTAALEEDASEDFGIAEELLGMETIDSIANALEFHRLPRGLTNRVIEAVAAHMEVDESLALAGALDTIFSFAPLPDSSRSKPLMLIGVSGAGKTATAAKLCARARLAGQETSLITMDGAKAGALAQVAAFAQALGTTIDQAADAAELRLAVKDCKADHLVIIDTVGSSPFEDSEIIKLASAAEAAGADVAVVLPAGCDAAESAETALAFSEVGAKFLIPTKLDTSRRLGGVLSAALAGRLAFMGAGNSPNIGGGLVSINPVVLARLLLPSAVLPQNEGWSEALASSPLFAGGRTK